MSRRVVEPLPEFAGCEIAVGWYPTDGTFFAYVLDRRGPEPTWLVNTGSAPGELRGADVVIAAIRPYAVVPAGLAEDLAVESFARAVPAPRPPLDVLAGRPSRPAATDPAPAPEPAPPAVAPQHSELVAPEPAGLPPDPFW